MQSSRRILRQPALHGGISLQPASQRFPTQFEDASNFVFSVFANGAIKRPGTCFIRQTLLLEEDGDYRMHAINRDGTERYLVVYGNGGDVHVFDDTGMDAQINAEGAALSYLMQNDPTAPGVIRGQPSSACWAGSRSLVLWLQLRRKAPSAQR